MTKGFEVGKFYKATNSFGWVIYRCEVPGEWASLRFICNFNNAQNNQVYLHRWDSSWSELSLEEKALLL